MDVNNDAGGNNGGGNERPVWLDSLPDAHKNNQSFYGFKEPAQAWDKFDSLLKAEGKTIVIPDEKATPEELKAFYAKLGVPETSDGYEFDKADIEAEADKMFREVMFTSRIPKREAKAIHKAFVDMIGRGKEAMAKQKAEEERIEKESIDEAVNTLKDTWKGDLFKANTELAHRAFKNVIAWAGIGEEEGKKFLEESKIGNLQIGNHPVILRLFHAIATKISNDSIGGDRGGIGGEGSEEEKAKQRFPNTKFKT
jgi:hypothetical protein